MGGEVFLSLLLEVSDSSRLGWEKVGEVGRSRNIAW